MTLTTEQRMNMRATLRAANIRARGLDDNELKAEYEKLTNTKVAPELPNKPAPIRSEPWPEKETAPFPREDSKPVDSAPVMPTVPGIDQNAMAQLMQALALLMPQQTAPVVDENTLIALIKKHATFNHIVEVIPPKTGPVITIENAHKELAFILDCVNSRNGDNSRMNVYVYGPAGSGKTTLGFQVSEALQLQFYSMGAIMTPYELIGSKDAHSNYAETAFYLAYKFGGVFLQDEIDSCSPRALLCINQALANDRFTFPNGETVMRHSDFVYIAGANTIGKGATLEYVGRAQLDAATIDRFFQIPVNYEDNVERVIALKTAAINGMDTNDTKNMQSVEAWINDVQAARKKALDANLKVVISPRTTARGIALLAKGYQYTTVKTRVLETHFSEDQRKQLAI